MLPRGGDHAGAVICTKHFSISPQPSVTLIGPNSCLWVPGAEDIEGVIAVQPKYTRPSSSPNTPTTHRLFSAADHATNDLDISETPRMVDSPRHDLMNGILSTLVFHFHHSSSYATLTFGFINIFGRRPSFAVYRCRSYEKRKHSEWSQASMCEERKRIGRVNSGDCFELG